MNVNQKIGEIPAPEMLLKRLTVYSIIDVIMNQGQEYDASVYHCNTDWNAGVVLFTIDDGGGDHFHILFSEAGSIIKGFGHESGLSPYNYSDDETYPDYRFYDGAPAELLELLQDEALEKDLVTFCVWRRREDTAWLAGKIDVPADWNDGVADFLDYMSDTEDYATWLNEYYETDIPASLITELLNGAAVTEDTVNLLNPDVDAEETMFDVSAIKRAAVL